MGLSLKCHKFILARLVLNIIPSTITQQGKIGFLGALALPLHTETCLGPASWRMTALFLVFFHSTHNGVKMQTLLEQDFQVGTGKQKHFL